MFLGSVAERHANTNGTTTEDRYYSIGSTSLAVKSKVSSSATVTTDCLLGDVRGSVALTVRQGASATSTQWYSPYGAKRGTATLGPTKRGYIGQQMDTATGLNYLNARYQDPATGVFLSVDPLVAKTGEPYIYAGGNPTTMSDPGGLEAGANGEDKSCRAKGTCGSAGNANDREDRRGGSAPGSGGVGSGGGGGVTAPQQEMTHRYSLSYVIGVFAGDGPTDVAKLFFEDPNLTFPFVIAGDFGLGGTVRFEGDPLPSSPAEVVFMSDTQFGFKSLEGHLEGEGNFIMFEFSEDDWGQTVLSVESYGPPEGARFSDPPLVWMNNDFVRHLWFEFASGLSFVATSRLETVPCCPGRD